MLAIACNLLNNSSSLTLTYFDEKGQCNIFVRIANQTYDNITSMCNNVFYRIKSTCGLVTLANQSDVNSYIQRRMLRVRIF